MVNSPSATFRFRGRPVPTRPGETLLTALREGRVPILQRSIRYHRPRAPFCGVGYCTQCLVRVNGVPNVRACRYLPNPGDRVETENAWPSPAWDLLGVLDILFYRGLDTLRGFRRPAFATPLYHRVVRRLAGYGELPDASPHRPTIGRRLETDVLVIGSGTAGTAALRTFAEHGVRCLGVERERGTENVPGADRFEGTTAVFLPPPGTAPTGRWRLIAVAGPTEGIEVRANSVIVATGGYDAGLWFAGSDRPGVMTAEGALSMCPPGAPPPFERAVVFGASPRVGELLDRVGPQVEAIIAPGTIPGDIAVRASALEIPLYPRSLLLEARGRDGVRSVRGKTRGGGPEFSLRADAVVLAHRRLPNPQLFFQAGAKMEWRRGGAAYYPVLTADGATTVPGLYGAGEAAGFLDPAAAAQSGAAAARAAIGRPPDGRLSIPRVEADAPHVLEGYYAELLGGPRGWGKWVACACEDVLLPEVEAAHRDGYRGIEVIKRYTGAGTGLCQGRYCIPDLLLLLSRLENRPAAEVGYITQRPPVIPVPLAALASLPDEESEEAAV